MYNIKRFFSVNTKRAVKISADILVLRTHDNICFSPHMKKYIWHSSYRVNKLYIFVISKPNLN